MTIESKTVTSAIKGSNFSGFDQFLIPKNNAIKSFKAGSIF